MFQDRSLIWRLGAFVLIVAAILVTDRIGAFRQVENAATETRMALAPRAALGGIAFIGIDNRSLEAVGAWPWPRETYGAIARRLIDLGAVEVFFDIDFSAPSNETSDAALAEAIEELGSSIILPAFQQAEGIGARPGAMSDNLPLPALREHAWLASVNVAPDADGRVRRYPYGHRIAGEDIPSVAALLSGDFGSSGGDFDVNYAIRPGTVPSFAAIDLLEGRIDTDQIAGRSVVVGAHAIELRDNIPVPVHGIVPGSILQILAAETLIQGVPLIHLPKLTIFAVVAVLAIAVSVSGLARRPLWLFLAFAVTACAIEVAAFLLQTRSSLVLSTPVVHVTLISMGLAVAASELGLRRWLLTVARLERNNSDSVLQRIISDSSDAIVIVDETGAVIEMSKRTHDVFGLERHAKSAVASLEDAVPKPLAAAVRDAMAAFRERTSLGGDVRELAFDIDGETRHIEYTIAPSRLTKVRRGMRSTDDTVVACLTARDVTLAWQQQARLDHLARFDAMTGAMNRGEFIERLEARLAVRGSGTPVVIVLNLHRFRIVNASLGREVGNRLLCAVVGRVSDVDPRLSEIGRLGADTFAIFCSGLDRTKAEGLTRRLIAAIGEPFELNGASARVGVRVGLAFGKQGATAAGLLESAEIAVDEARSATGEGYRIFDPDSVERQERARLIERSLWTAIERDEFHLVYQPQVDLRSGEVIGAEALVRWRHSELGMVSPAEFIEIAENSGFIEHLGPWVLERACRDAAGWPSHMTVAVNVSPLQFQRSDVAADACRALTASGMGSGRLHLEITETIFAESSPELVGTLAALRAMGVSIALDDFGSGFSSFGYLSKLPLDKLKLDRMFVQYLEEDPSNAAIIRSVATLSHDLGLTLVCEGVETAAQAEFLRATGCDQAQGYFFGKPQDQSALLAAVAAVRSSPIGLAPVSADAQAVAI